MFAKVFTSTRNTLIACLASAALVFPSIAQAQTPAYSFTSAPTSNDTYLSLGFVFTTNAPVTVSALGYYDYWYTILGQTTGLHAEHTVGIFDSMGNLLTSTIVDAGNSDPLTGDFRYKQITPYTLAAGNTYTLAATTDSGKDPWAYGIAGSSITGFTTDASIGIGIAASRYWYDGDNVLRDPPYFYAYTIYGGPNFLIGSSNVPEPGAYAVLGSLGLTGAAFLRRRRAR
jgi:hypothetical protein